MKRSLSVEAVREYGPRMLRLTGGGLIALFISAFLISLRILLCDDSDIIWDHPSMFWDVVKMAYAPDSRSEWGPLWDIVFAVVPMWVFVGAFAPRIWEPDADPYAAYRGIPWNELRQPAAPPPALEWGYEEYEVVRPSEPVVRSRTTTLRGFPALRPPAEPAKPAPVLRSTSEGGPTQEEIDKGWTDPT